MWPIFWSVTYYSKCDPFFQVWPIFPIVTHFSKCDSFFQMWPIFPNVTNFSKYDPFFQMWRIFSNVTHYSKCDLFFQVLPIAPNGTHFSSVAYYSKCDLFFHLFWKTERNHFRWTLVVYEAIRSTPRIKFGSDRATVQNMHLPPCSSSRHSFFDRCKYSEASGCNINCLNVFNQAIYGWWFDLPH